MDPLVTVVVTTHNRIEFLREAVDSVKAQRGVALELVLVDDGSTDSTPQYVRQLEAEGIRTRRFDESVERSTARNCGLAEARGEFVLFLDDDDRLLPTAISGLLAALRRHPSAVGAVGARVAFDAAHNRRRAPQPRIPLERVFWPELLLGWLPGWWAGAGQCLFRTEAVRKVGGWNEQMIVGEDQELLLRLSLLGRVVFRPQTVLEVRIHDGQWRPPNVAELDREFRLRFLELLPQAEESRARSILRAGEMLRAATAAYNEQQFGTALGAIACATRTAPAIAVSPVVGPRLWTLSLKAVAGVALPRRVSKAIQSAQRATRVRLKRELQSSVTQTGASAIRR